MEEAEVWGQGGLVFQPSSTTCYFVATDELLNFTSASMFLAPKCGNIRLPSYIWRKTNYKQALLVLSSLIL